MVAFDPETPLIFSGEGETGLFKAKAFFARDGRLIKLCIVGEEGTTIDTEICVSAVTLAVSMGKTKMRPTSIREPMAATFRKGFGEPAYSSLSLP
jgi:hypothetical protein